MIRMGALARMLPAYIHACTPALFPTAGAVGMGAAQLHRPSTLPRHGRPAHSARHSGECLHGLC